MKKLTIFLSTLAILQLVALLSIIPSSAKTVNRSSSDDLLPSRNFKGWKSSSERLTRMMVGPDSNVFFSRPKDPRWNKLPQKYTEEVGARNPGEEYVDHLGNHHWYREPRPFEVTHSTKNFKWTAEDGRSPEIMKQIANNSLMLEELERTNSFVTKRQLLYVAGDFGEKGHEVFHGQRDEVVLPGPDGQEFVVKISDYAGDETDDNAPMTGVFTGTIVGQPGSRVEAASQEDYWSIGIRTADGKSYELINREHGELILSEIDLVAQAEHDDFGCGANLGEDHVGSVQPSQENH